MNDDNTSAFSNEQFEVIQELLSAIYIQTARNYDMLALIAPSNKAIALSELHEQGKILAPAPIWVIEENDE
jgi:hypothetical protein